MTKSKRKWLVGSLAALSTVVAALVAYAGTNVTFNGSSYTIPAVADANWGTNVSNYLIAIANGTLQKSGGAFTLTSEVDFGATYGLKSAYLKSKTSNVASAGALRLAKTDFIQWRNNANGADLPLGINGSDALTFNSVAVPTVNSKLSAFAATTSAELAGVISDETGSGALVFGTSPTLTTPTLGVATATSINGTTIPSSKTLVTTTDTLGSLATTSSIVLQGIISDPTGSGSLVFGTSPTLKGTVLLQNSSGAQPELALSEDPDNGTNKITIKAPASISDYTLTLPEDDGASGQLLSTNGSGVLSWASPLSNPMTTTGDIIYSSDNSGTPERLAAGTTGNWLVSAGEAAPTWSDTVDGTKTFKDGLKVDDAAEQSTLSFFAQTTQAATFTSNGTSGGTSASVTMRIQRIGDWVSLYVPDFSATSGTGSPSAYTASAALPSWARPATTSQLAYGGTSRNSGASSGEIARVAIPTTGIISVSRNSQGSVYTTSASAGLQTPAHITYYVGTGS